MTETHRSPLVLTKLAAPRLRPEHLDRADLLAMLVDGRHRLSLLDAPAGYGKTTLLTAWQQADPRAPFAWVSLDDTDADPRRFWSYVTTAVSRARPAAGERLAVPPSVGAPAIADVVLPRLINAIAAIPDEVVLVLEDFHRLRPSVVHEQVAALLERGPPNLHVAVSTRAEPVLPLARLRAEGELVALTADHLAFGAEEVRALLNERLGLGLGEDGIARLLERTQGWPAGVYLAALALANSPDRDRELDRFATGRRHVIDYFVDEVLADLPPGEAAFLRRAAILSEVNGPLLDSVLGAEDSAARLRRLERSNLLVLRLDGESEWYRFHPIFGRLLSGMLAEEDPALVRDLLLRASAWYAEHGFPSRAIDHAFSAGHPEAAADLIAAEWQPIGDFVRNQSFASWLSALPDERIAADPRLALAAAWTAGWGGIPGSWQDWLRRVEATSEPLDLPLGLHSAEAAAALTRAVYGYDDVGNHLEAAREAAALFADDPALFGLADAALGVALYHAGLLAEARTHLAASVDRVAAAFPPALPPALAYLSLCFTAGGEPAEGLSCAESASDRVRAADGPRHGGADGLVEFALGAALRALGRSGDALAALDRAIELLRDDTLRLDLAQARIERGLTLLALGRHTAARVELTQAEAVMAQCPDPGAGALHLRAATARARAPLPGGSPEGARLSEREREILALLPSDLSRREIAAELFVSFNTVQTHLRAIYRKLGVGSRAQAVARARELDLLDEGSAARS